MRKWLLFLMIAALCTTGCLKKSSNDTDKDSVGYFMTNLKADMNYSQIVNVFGEPDGDIGSGIHIYVYNLSDGSQVYIGYADKIIYANHVSSSRELLHKII